MLSLASPYAPLVLGLDIGEELPDTHLESGMPSLSVTGPALHLPRVDAAVDVDDEEELPSLDLGLKEHADSLLEAGMPSLTVTGPALHLPRGDAAVDVDDEEELPSLDLSLKERAKALLGAGVSSLFGAGPHMHVNAAAATPGRCTWDMLHGTVMTS